MTRYSLKRATRLSEADIADKKQFIIDRAKAKKTLTVYVPQQSHSNQDSLPLRYGVHFNEDVLLEIFDIAFLEHDATYCERLLVRSKFADDAQIVHEGVMVLQVGDDIEEPLLITVWLHDLQTEYMLSETMRLLRKDGCLTPQMLLKLHPLYRTGQLVTHSELVRELAKLMGAEERARLEHAAKQAFEQVEQMRAEVEKLREQAAAFAQENDQLKVRLVSLEQELVALKREQSRAATNNEFVTVSDSRTLQAVEERMHRGSMCTVLTFADKSQKFMKQATFDRDGSVTRKALTLIGRTVKTTCWDPVREPNKWTAQGYFRNIYELSDEDFAVSR